MRKLLARFASWLHRKTRPTHEVLQLHLIGTIAGKDFFQVAQRRFALPANPGERLAWISEMVGKCSAAKPITEIYTEGDPQFIRVTLLGWSGNPLFLPCGCGHAPHREVFGGASR